MGRKPKYTKDTKLKAIMLKKKIRRKDLVEKINTQNLEQPISPDAVSRIYNGSREDYKISTLLRLCRALKVTPNQLINYEDVISKK